MAQAYTIENDFLAVQVSSKGAELTSVIQKQTGNQLLWQANPLVWNRHAPVLFPHCGALCGGTLTAKGQTAQSPQHGFARDCDFELVSQTGRKLTLRLTANEVTKRIYPYDFVLDAVYSLQGNILTQTMQVANPLSAKEILPFNIGFHPGFAVTDGGAGWAFKFEKQESPLVIHTPGGLVDGKISRYGAVKSIALTNDLFAQDSICFTGLQSSYIDLYQPQGTGKVRVGIAGFPYVLLWGQAKGPHQYVCIEPWHGVPDPAKPYGDFYAKPGVQSLPAGESFSTSLTMQFG